MILSVLVGLVALAGMVLFIIILISPTKTTFMNKWACNNNLGGGNCVRSSDGYNTESDCMDQCFPCKERKSVESCGLPGDCGWDVKTCHACSDFSSNELKCKQSQDCTYTPPTSSDLEGICARSAPPAPIPTHLIK